jgi:peptide/nickel transport system substrate-binding protein
MFMPDSDGNYPKAAQFIAAWYDELGVNVTTQVFSSAALTEIIYPPEGGEGYTANYDIELWGWSGGIDPNGLLSIFKCDAIGDSSDSQYCNPEFDKMYDDQLAAETAEERKTILAEMQNLVYDILYYDANLVGYRTDRFAGFVNQPEVGTPFFTYSTLQYTKLTDATLATPEPSVAPAPSGSDVAVAPSAVPTTGDPGAASSTTPILLGLLAVVAIVAVGVAFSRRRAKAAGGTEDDE